jgi:hypothetical protein
MAAFIQVDPGNREDPTTVTDGVQKFVLPRDWEVSEQLAWITKYVVASGTGAVFVDTTGPGEVWYDVLRATLKAAGKTHVGVERISIELVAS